MVFALVPIAALLSGVWWVLSLDGHTSAPAVVVAPEATASPSQTARVVTAAPSPSPSPSATASPASTATAAATAVAAAPATGSSGGSGVFVARLRIPRISVDASVVTLNVAADGTMPAPSRPMEVATYDFAAFPGEIGNVVLAAHVDFAGFGPAVFYRLRELSAGDEFSVALNDGSYFVYRVVWVAVYDDENAPVGDIVGPTSTETATLITCTGVFDRSAHAYNERLVVRANRIT